MSATVPFISESFFNPSPEDVCLVRYCIMHQMSGLYSGASVAPTSDVLAMTSSGTIFMLSLVTSPDRENYYRDGRSDLLLPR
jgi:hypothetical protein